MNILFVCKYNRFRSRVAEALFNHYNKDKSIHVKSAGLLDYEEGYRMISGASKALNELGIAYDSEKGAVHLTDEMIEWADKIYVVADDASLEGLPVEKVEQVQIPDSYATATQCMQTVMQIDFFIRSICKA